MAKKAASKTPNRKRASVRTESHDALTIPFFTPSVTAKIEQIQNDMPIWWHHYEAWLIIRETVGEIHHPVLWFLGGQLMEFSLQKQGKRKRQVFNAYPVLQGDLDQVRGDNHKLRDFEGMWSRAYERLKGDILELCALAVRDCDVKFFEKWSGACLAVAKWNFGLIPIEGRREWQDGKWLGEIDWAQPGDTVPRQRKSNLKSEILTSRLNLWLRNGRIPTDTEVADFIIEYRRSEKRLPKAEEKDPKGYRRKLRSSVSTVTKRMKLSRAVTA